jgi:hypothetical protein
VRGDTIAGCIGAPDTSMVSRLLCKSHAACMESQSRTVISAPDHEKDIGYNLSSDITFTPLYKMYQKRLSLQPVAIILNRKTDRSHCYVSFIHEVFRNRRM